MLEYAREATEMASGRSREDLDTDRQFSLALTRLLEIIGEAAARVEPGTAAALPDVPWPQIVSLRNRLIHGYDDVDHEIMWNIVSQNLPPLIGCLEAFLTSSTSAPTADPATPG